MKRVLLIIGLTVIGISLWSVFRSGSTATPSVDRQASTVERQTLTMTRRNPDGIAPSKFSDNRTTLAPAPTSATQPLIQNPGTAPQVAALVQSVEPASFSKTGHRNVLSSDSVASGADETPPRDAITPKSPPQPLRPTPAIRWPLALQELDLQVAGLNAEQVATLDEIADSFIANVGGEDQTASDPNYRKRWQAQQPNADQQFRTLYGTKAFLQAQLATTHEATQPPPATEP